jgi:hypothetical protein
MTVTYERCAGVVSRSVSWEAHGSARNIRLNKQSAKEVVCGNQSDTPHERASEFKQ